MQATNLPVLGITLYDVDAGKSTLTARLFNTDSVIISQQFMLKPKTHSTFELREVKGVLRIVPVSETEFVAIKSAPAEKELPIDVATPVESAAPPYHMSTNLFLALKEELEQIQFEGKKLNRMKNYVAVNALSTNQLRQLMSYLELEENKIKMLEAAWPMITDKAQFEFAAQDFLLEKNIIKAKKIAGQ